MSRSARAAKGFATSILQYLTQIVLQIVLAPLVLKLAGRETLGAYAAISQTLSLLALVDIAGSWALERFLGQARGIEDGGARFRNVFTTSRTISLFTNVVFALLVLLFSLCIAWMFHLGEAVAAGARHALYVIAAWAIVRTPLIAYENALIATQDLVVTNSISALVGILRAVASLAFVLFGAGLFGLMLSGTVAAAAGSILYRTRFRRLHADLMPAWGIPDPSLLREMLGFSFHSVFLNIGNMLFFTSGNMLAGLTNGAAAASSFYTSQMPTNTIYTMINRLTDSATPAINELYGAGELERLKHVFLRLVRLLLIMAMPMSIGVLLFNRDVVTTWVGAQQYAGPLLTVSLSIYCVTLGIQNLAILFAFVFGWVRLLSISALLQGVANLGLAFYFGKRFGVGGVTLALVVVLLPQLVLLLRKIDSFLHIASAVFMGRCLLQSVIPLIAASAVSFTLHRHLAIEHKHYAALFAELGAFVAIYSVLAWLLQLAPEDRADARRYASAINTRLHSLIARFASDKGAA
jgi:O-antigen/teichoic acid export membrane protein